MEERVEPAQEPRAQSTRCARAVHEGAFGAVGIHGGRVWGEGTDDEGSVLAGALAGIDSYEG